MWGSLAVHWLHVVLSILWFGGSLYVNIVAIPVLLQVPVAEQRPITAALSRRTTMIFRPVQIAAIILGVLRGTVFGQIDSIDALRGTKYGLTFLAALVAAITQSLFANLITGPAARKLGTFPVEGVVRGEGPVFEAYSAQVTKAKMFVAIELLGFFAIYTMMVFMRYNW